MSKRTAIKAYCRECAGGTYPEVILCHLTDCPLWPYRTGYSAAATAKSMKMALAKLTRMMLNAVDKRLSKAERALWQKQAWFMAKRIEEGRIA